MPWPTGRAKAGASARRLLTPSNVNKLVALRPRGAASLGMFRDRAGTYEFNRVYGPEKN